MKLEIRVERNGGGYIVSEAFNTFGQNTALEKSIAELLQKVRIRYEALLAVKMHDLTEDAAAEREKLHSLFFPERAR